MPPIRPAALLAACLLPLPAAATTVNVATSTALYAAVSRAHPGDDIVLADGDYAVSRKLEADIDATPAAPITVRAAHPLAARIHSTGIIAFEVVAPNWHFDGLDISGECASDTDCEHAFHVVGHASGFHLTNSRLRNFNAHIKVNADDIHTMPADGLIENNEFFDTHPRHTGNPVAPVNIDDSISWVVRGNLIHDFQKEGAGEGSYGVFVKGGSQSPIIERNLVECSSNHPAIGQMVGISLGAHGMAPALCPPHWSAAQICDPEVSGGIVRNNIVGNCSDDGIYLNKGLNSKILFNTLIRTGGIEFRYKSSTGIATGNLMTGAIKATEGGTFTDGGNVVGLATEQQVQATKKSFPADALAPEDYCGRKRGAMADAGALQASLGACALLHWAGRK